MSDENARKGGSRVLYGPALQHARQTGDVAEMRRLAQQAQGSDDPEVKAALRDVQAELDKAGNG